MWRTMETAPKDGTLVLLLSREHTAPADQWHEAIHHAPRINIGKWSADGTSWVDENGLLGGDCYTRAKTGFWESGGGWFQPNEVTHWHPLPDLPKSVVK